MLWQSVSNFSDIQSTISTNPNVVTLFSGGLDSSYLLYRLQKMGCNVIALYVDVGDSESISQLSESAHRYGAELVCHDAREQLVYSAVLPAIQAQARYLGHFPISSSLTRPIMAEAAVKVAKERGCGCILHTANTSQNSLRRLNGAIKSLNFFGSYGSPYELDVTSRAEKTAALCNTFDDKFSRRERSGDSNLWCREFESGDLDNPEFVTLKESMYLWTKNVDQDATEIEIDFVAGIPTAIDKRELEAPALIEELNLRVGSYGIGRFEGLEHLESGEKVFEVREAPAAHILMQAYHHLSNATIDYEALREKHGLEQIWVREAVEGRWFSSLKDATQAFIEELSLSVTGSVRFTLKNGSMSMSGVRAMHPKYLTNRDLWEQNRSEMLRSKRTKEQAPEVVC